MSLKVLCWRFEGKQPQSVCFIILYSYHQNQSSLCRGNHFGSSYLEAIRAVHSHCSSPPTYTYMLIQVVLYLGVVCYVHLSPRLLHPENTADSFIRSPRHFCDRAEALGRAAGCCHRGFSWLHLTPLCTGAVQQACSWWSTVAKRCACCAQTSPFLSPLCTPSVKANIRLHNR